MGDRTSIEAPSSRTWKYQVFLSFRGEDTRKGFTGHLHAALSDAGIRAFLDDNELERAEFIKTQLEQAIHGSMISIIVFSKRYADSSWCLDELVKIMECRERLGQKVIPLFYNVDASDVRKQTGRFEQAFKKHKADICEGKHEKEKVQRWRNALTQAADLCGEDLKNADNGHEAKFIKKILGEVNKQLYSKYQLDIEHLVGITSRLNDVVRMIDIENSGSKDVVRMIGIWGMGGIGKTTLAKAIYNKFEGSFEGRSFLANVREVFAHQPITGLVGLQEQLLNDILKSQGIKVGSVAKGIDMIRERLCCKRALVIIDDADDLQQLKAIARARDWFGPGSRIVITTRNQHLLEQVGVDAIYMAQEMDEKEALELFGWHAFESGYPNQEYLDLSKRVIRYCQGLPLALEVVGSFLIKRRTAEWESHLEKLERSPDGDIQKILRISFDGLPDQEKKEIFLDISCFFIGMDKDYVAQILKGCGFAQPIGISVLIERCLVTVSEENKLMMHDLLRDMGREIIYENAQGHREKFSRLWKHEDITDVLSDESGTKKIEGVALDLDLDLTRFSAQAFTNMKKLRLLHLSGVELTGEYKDFPKKLIWLCWHYFPLESIPDDFPMQPKLVALDLQHSKLKIVWKDCKVHENLKILNLSYCIELTKSPDFSKLPNLEELILQSCWSLSEVHSSIGDLGRLSLVNLEGCTDLEDLPLNFYKSKSIETLLLNGCSRFQNLADGVGDMVSLTILEADKTGIRQIPSSIVKLKKLRILSLSGCWLTEDAIPKDLCSLISLEDLLLGDNVFCSLPSLAGLSKLKVLCVNACKNLRAIPDLPTNLYVLKANECPELETIPDFSKMWNMRELYLSDSFKLTEVPGLDKSLNSMKRIHMEGCTNLTADFRDNILQGWTSCGYGGIFLSGNDIPDWFDCVHDDDIVYFTVPQSDGRNLKGLTLSFGFSSSSERYGLGFHISIKNMTKGIELEARIIPVSNYQGYYLWQGQLSNDELKLQDGDKVLIEIIVDKWVKVKKTGVNLVWDKFMNENMIDYHLCAYERRSSQNLVNDDDIIHVEYDYDIRKSPDFSKFPNLKKLILKDCPHLSKVHSSIGDLGRLSLVNLQGCYMLKDLPLNLYKSKSIETLILNGCSSFHNLADGLGDMVSLTILEADDTWIRQIPSSIVKLKKLRILSLSELCLAGCRLSTEDDFPKDLCSLISLEDLLLGGNDFRSLPSLAGLSKLKVLCLTACRKLLAIPDLPTNLYVLEAIYCPELETIPDFSKMRNMRELYLSDSFKLTEVPGLDKSLNSMTRIHMEGCTNLTADFRNNILQRWTSCGFGGIYLNGIYDIPEWFELDDDVDNIVFFEVPQIIMGCDLKGLTICFVYSSDRPKLVDSEGPIGIIVRNLTKQTALHTKIAFASLKNYSEHEDHLRRWRPEDHYLCPGQLSKEPEDHYLWQGQLSNDVLCLQGGDRVSILVRPHDVDFVRVKKTGVHLEWDKVMKENMDNPDPHLYDLETNGDFSGGVDDSISRNRENKGRKSKRRRIGSFDYV
ncbi:disease resistance protein LAZ5 isoform X3 [Prunus persica]|uniref:disease resistance protein LAZ5 isoform X3 n=1 Tax=Prunus persica TaxID=3760 RepID=UPI0009AB4DB4|nr:disease resistance protein LAZ5 isoform X3 [Prunus persica]